MCPKEFPCRWFGSTSGIYLLYPLYHHFWFRTFGTITFEILWIWPPPSEYLCPTRILWIFFKIKHSTSLRLGWVVLRNGTIPPTLLIGLIITRGIPFKIFARLQSCSCFHALCFELHPRVTVWVQLSKWKLATCETCETIIGTIW